MKVFREGHTLVSFPKSLELLLEFKGFNLKIRIQSDHIYVLSSYQEKHLDCNTRTCTMYLYPSQVLIGPEKPKAYAITLEHEVLHNKVNLYIPNEILDKKLVYIVFSNPNNKGQYFK